jgi:hypothetical protein
VTRAAKLRGWLPWIAAAALLCAISVAVLAPLSTRPADVLYAPTNATTDTSRADVRLTAWLLARGAHSFSSGHVLDVFDANI